ncbi:MAG: DUF4931 domain-containing protein [Ignavibacteriales bacterium]
MPELRKDPLTGTWVVIATERGKRPSDFARPAPAAKGGTCPFCYGSERMTPPEVLAYRDGSEPDTPGWSVRVVPNKFPALSPDLEREEARRFGPFLEMNASGGHEVLIESPKHDSTLGTHDAGQVELILRAVKERLVHYRDSGRVEYVQVFKNAGPAAGASLEHTHFQMISLPLVPDAVERETAKMRGNGGHKCALCDIREYESGRGERVIDRPDGYLVCCPFASRFPYETWIVPDEHEAHFEDLTDEGLRRLAPVLRDTVGRLESAFENVPYNLILHTAPFGVAWDGFHWHIEILPRLTIAAGFEFGTGQFINPTPPEMAARFLRETGLRREYPVGARRLDTDEGDRPSDTGS